MALDLFLAPHKPKSRSKSAARKGRLQMFDALLLRYPGIKLVGDGDHGHIENFPLGELYIRPLDLHWALHGVQEEAPIHAMADWFLEQGYACEDPQGAGFERPRLEPLSVRSSLDDLVGSQWLGLKFDRNYSTALDLDFTLADGRVARLRMLHLGQCRVPELSPLVKAVVVSVDLQQGEAGSYDSLTLKFSGGHDLVFIDAVFGDVQVAERGL